MTMRNRLKYVVLSLFVLLIVSCNSMKSDAKKAASLINKSVKQTHALKFDKAEKSYLKAQEIINNYKEKGKTEEFYEIFIALRDKERKQNAN